MKTSAISLTKLPRKYQDQVAALAGYRPSPTILPRTMAINPTKDEAKLNKTEAAFLAHLRATGWPWVGIQSMTLKLGDDCRYTPDFQTFRENHLVMWEVKGFWRDDARVKIKTAARMFPFLHFMAVSRRGRASDWAIEDIRG